MKKELLEIQTAIREIAELNKSLIGKVDRTTFDEVVMPIAKLTGSIEGIVIYTLIKLS